MIKFKDKNIKIGDRVLFCGVANGFLGGKIFRILDLTADAITFSSEEKFGSWHGQDVNRCESVFEFMGWIDRYNDISVLDPRTIVRLREEGLALD